jgi:hypothetical protein
LKAYKNKPFTSTVSVAEECEKFIIVEVTLLFIMQEFEDLWWEEKMIEISNKIEFNNKGVQVRIFRRNTA